jgi:hypothetical protein
MTGDSLVGASARWDIGSAITILLGIAVLVAGVLVLLDRRGGGTTYARRRLYGLQWPWKRPVEPTLIRVRRERLHSGSTLAGFGVAIITVGLASLLRG